MPYFLYKDEDFLVAGEGKNRRVQLVGLKFTTGQRLPDPIVSEWCTTERQAQYQLANFYSAKYIRKTEMSRLMDTLEELGLERGSFVEICSQCNEHGAIRIGDTLFGDFDSQQHGHDVYWHIENRGLPRMICDLIIRDLERCMLPKVSLSGDYDPSRVLAMLQPQLRCRKITAVGS